MEQINQWITQEILNFNEFLEQKYLIYQIDFSEESEEKMKVTVRYWIDHKLHQEASTVIYNWNHQSAALSSYLSGIYRARQDFLQTEIERIVSYTGSQIWQLIHDKKGMQLVWESFQNDVRKYSWLFPYILVSGKDLSISTPIECIAYTDTPGTLIRERKIPLLRCSNLFETDVKQINEFLSHHFPEDIIVLLGNDSDITTYGRKLDYFEEVKKWHELLTPNKKVSDDEIRYLLATGGDLISEDASCRIKVVSSGNLGYLESVVCEQKRPFLFLYIGHGEYIANDFYQDGDLKIDQRQINGSENTSQEMLVEILRKGEPFGIFLNCCEGFRSVELKPAHGADYLYFSYLYSLRLLSGFRSKVLDKNAQLISLQLISSILQKDSIYNFTRKFGYSFSNSYSPKDIRDHVSNVKVIR